MEYKHTKQIQIQKVEEPATDKQKMYIARLASELGFQVNTTNMTKEGAMKRIDLLRSIKKMENHQRLREKEVKLSMVKKLIYKKWVAQNKEINKQSEKLFMKEVYYVSEVFDKIDEMMFSEEAV
jgi:predicted nucleic acid-binding Zn ribbon protein